MNTKGKCKAQRRNRRLHVFEILASGPSFVRIVADDVQVLLRAELRTP